MSISFLQIDEVIMESSSLHSLFQCLLCRELLQLPTVINECLHRFCQLCITNYFAETTNKTCPVCQMILLEPLQTLKSDLTFQRLLYKIYHRQIACRSSRVKSNKLTSIQIDTKIHVYLDHWDISLDLCPNESVIRLSKCYLECLANTPLLNIEKFLRVKHALAAILKIEFFYQSFLLNTTQERLIDICHCFNITNQNSSVEIRFIISPYGYKTLLKRIRQSQRSTEGSLPANHSSFSSTSSTDSTLKVKICRSQNSANNWFIPHSTPSIDLPDLINSCEKQIKQKKKSKPPRRRRLRFLPTMVKAPPSMFDYLMIEKTICKIPPYISENTLADNTPLDLSLK